MRKVVGNHVVTVPLVGEYYVTSVPQLEISYPNTYTVVEAVDLNGDGTLEVVVDVRRWEGWGAIVYRVDGQNVREVNRGSRSKGGSHEPLSILRGHECLLPNQTEMGIIFM